MKQNTWSLWLMFLFIGMVSIACNQKKHVAVLVKDGLIQLCDGRLTTAEAMVIDQGKVVATGKLSDLLQQYEADTQISVPGKFIYPGLIDAHCHFYGLGRFMQMVDLTGAKSFEEVVETCRDWQENKQQKFLIGRGWDQNIWVNQSFPNNQLLNQAFPHIPVILKRIDGHAAIVNEAALRLAGIDSHTKVLGGEIILYDGKPSGVLVDNAVDLLEKIIPPPSYEEKIEALLTAQDICLSYGLTGVTDAGLETEIIELIDSLQQVGKIKMRINAMVSISPQNVDYWLNRGVLKTEVLQVNSFKMYADGALGSRGACLLEAYSDQPKHMGLILTQAAEMENYVKKIASSPFQLNTHAIGDSANRLVLNLYGKYIGNQNDRRWRIEHAQVVNGEDFKLFGHYGIVPSVQPTHATSDMIWAKNRLGSNRIKTAYAYKQLLNELGWIPLGTDFPVEYVSPYFTFYAAVARKNSEGTPADGFQMENALSRKEALLGMTQWAAKGAFLEKEMGSLVPGNFADFVVLDQDLIHGDMGKIRSMHAASTYIGGKDVKLNN